jgi:hypothetical protein
MRFNDTDTGDSSHHTEGTGRSGAIRIALRAGLAVIILAAVAFSGFWVWWITRRPVEDKQRGLPLSSLITQYGNPTCIDIFTIATCPKDEVRRDLPRYLPDSRPEDVIQEYYYHYPCGDTHIFWLARDTTGNWVVFSDYFVPAGWE